MAAQATGLRHPYQGRLLTSASALIVVTLVAYMCGVVYQHHGDGTAAILLEKTSPLATGSAASPMKLTSTKLQEGDAAPAEGKEAEASGSGQAAPTGNKYVKDAGTWSVVGARDPPPPARCQVSGAGALLCARLAKASPI